MSIAPEELPSHFSVSFEPASALAHWGTIWAGFERVLFHDCSQKDLSPCVLTSASAALRNEGTCVGIEEGIQ